MTALATYRAATPTTYSAATYLAISAAYIRASRHAITLGDYVTADRLATWAALAINDATIAADRA